MNVTTRGVALVTGAGSGIGRAEATSLADAGQCMYASMRYINGRNKERAKGVEELNALHRAKQIALFASLGVRDLMSVTQSD